MDNNINKHFDFLLLEITANILEEEIEELERLYNSYYYDKWQREKLKNKAMPIIEKLKKEAYISRTEADRRKANIEKIKDEEVKAIVKMKYIEGKSLENIAELLYIDRTTASRKVKRYCNRHLGKG